jgi:hypothetical protein
LVKKTRTKKKGLKLIDILILGTLGFLILLPDPLDALTFFIPVVEGVAALAWTIGRGFSS